MARRACDGDGLLAALRAAVDNLEAHVEEINALNVYPVPDGDTGSNMLATVKAALAEAESSAGQPADRIPPAGQAPPGGRRVAARPPRRSDRRGDQLRSADGRPGQFGRDHEPDLPRH